MTPPAVIFVTQLIDEADPVLGFTTGLIRALAARTTVAVVAGEVRSVPSDLGAEVVSLGRERGLSKVRRGMRFEAAVARLARSLRPAALYAHMCPDYVTLAAPVTRATRTPAILWFTHSADSPVLRRAEKLADAVLTALPGSFPWDSPKVRAVGHSIDTARFAWLPPAPPPPAGAGTVQLVAAGRLSPVKNYPVILRAVAHARGQGTDVRLRVLGPASNRSEEALGADLVRLAADLGLGGAVEFGRGVAPGEVPAALAPAAALVNASRPGQADKVVFEAMACGRPVLVSSPAFAGLLDGLPLELRFADGDHEDLAAAIDRLAAAPPGVVEETARELRARVVAGHSLDHWAEEVTGLAASLRTGSASTAGRR